MQYALRQISGHKKKRSFWTHCNGKLTYPLAYLRLS